MVAYLEVCVDVRLDLASLVLSAAVSRRLRLRQGREEAILQPDRINANRSAPNGFSTLRSGRARDLATHPPQVVRLLLPDLRERQPSLGCVGSGMYDSTLRWVFFQATSLPFRPFRSVYKILNASGNFCNIQ